MTWTLPNIDLPRSEPVSDDKQMRKAGQRVVETFKRLGVDCSLEGISPGPTTVEYLLRAGEKAKMHDFRHLSRADDLAYALGVESIIVRSPVPGRSLVGVEAPNPCRRPVALGDTLSAASAPLTATLGLSSEGPVSLDISQAPHVLLAGKTGSGKSNLLHAILCSLLMVSSPRELSLVLGDSKMVELTQYEGLPHLAGKVLDSVDRIVDGFWWCVEEMEWRYEKISKAGCQNISQYNEKFCLSPLPYLLFAVDELADAALTAKGELESAVVRIGQKGRAAGVHLLLATQTPRREVFSGLTKANCPVRVALSTVTALDSRIILDQPGAEKLLGAGDGLLEDGASGALRRFQTPFVPQDIVGRIVESWDAQTREEAAA